jgi:enterochelin esterase-like enzyme
VIRQRSSPIQSYSLPGQDPQSPLRRIDVLAPPDYGDVNRRYPVIYMNDGDTAFAKGGLAGQSWGVPRRLERLYADSDIQRIIVVAIHPRDRDREYTHVHWNGQSCCGLESYASYVAEEVKPFIDRSYRTMPEARRTMILGSSHGGLAAFYTASRHSDRFGYAGALSPSFWVGLDDAEQFPLIKPAPRMHLQDSQLIQALKAKLVDSRHHPNLYLAWGLVRSGGLHNECIEERAAARGREMATLLESDYGYQLGSDLVIYEDPNGAHNEQSWGRQIPQIIKFFTRE